VPATSITSPLAAENTASIAGKREHGVNAAERNPMRDHHDLCRVFAASVGLPPTRGPSR